MPRKKSIQPFPFMADKDHDMVVAVRLTADEPANLRRLTVYYKLRKLISSFEHNVTDPKYKGDYVEFSKEMWQLLIGEIKSRVLARQEFVIWFYSQNDLDFVVDGCVKIASLNMATERFGEVLKKVSTLVPKL